LAGFVQDVSPKLLCRKALLSHDWLECRGETIVSE
jgi:hypothetical protein